MLLMHLYCVYYKPDKLQQPASGFINRTVSQAELSAAIAFSEEQAAKMKRYQNTRPFRVQIPISWLRLYLSVNVIFHHLAQQPRIVHIAIEHSAGARQHLVRPAAGQSARRRLQAAGPPGADRAEG